MSLKLDHADSFTAREITTLEQWLIAANAGDAVNADAILRTGLRAEHFESLLADDPAQRDPVDVEQLAELAAAADAAVATFEASRQVGPAAPAPEHDRGGA